MKAFLFDRCIIGAIFALYMLISPATAELVTFRFEAEILEVSNGSPFDLPFTLTQYDQTHGEFSFDTSFPTQISAGHSRTLQPFAFEFVIDGTKLAAEPFTILVLQR